MDDMLKEILEMDKKAQEKVKEAEQYRLDTISSLNEKKKQIIKEENERALESARSNSEKDKNLNEDYLKQIKIKNEKIIKNMDELFEENKTAWAERIFNETVGE